MRIKIYILLFISAVQYSLAQNNISRVIDNKIHISAEQINKIIKQNTIYSTVGNRALNSINSTTQITNDEIDDIELHAAINPTDTSNIVISWMNFDFSNSDLPLVFKMLYSNNFGDSWQTSNIEFFPRTLATNERVAGGGDPIIVFDNSGKAYFSWLYTIVRVITADEIYIDVYMTYATSEDNGANWERPTNGDDFISSGVLDYTLDDGITGVKSGHFPDKQWMAINPITNDLYISLAEFDTTDNYNTGIDTWGIRKKPANQTQFEDAVLVAPEGTVWASLGAIAINNQGDIHAIYPYYPTFPDPPLEKLMHAVSSDNGQTYSIPHYIADIDVTNFQGVGQTNNTSTNMYDRLYPSTYIAIDTAVNSIYEGRIYTCWNSNDANYNKKVDIWFSYSDNNGSTWSTPKIVNSDPPRDYGFHHRPTIYVNPDGVLILAWFDNRGFEIPDVYMNNYYYALSYDGGETFEEHKVSPEAWNYNDNNFNSDSGVGEYFQILATKHNILAFYPMFDGNDTEIYFTKLGLGETTQIKEVSSITDKVIIKSIYPNPVKKFLNIDINLKEKSNIKLSIIDINGKLIEKYPSKQYTEGINHIEMNVNNYYKGDYIIIIETNFGHFTRKWIKN